MYGFGFLSLISLNLFTYYLAVYKLLFHSNILAYYFT